MIFKVYDNILQLAVLFDEDTGLPYIVRSYEDHPIFGPSTHDLLMMDYITVAGGVKVPTQFKTIYNQQHLLTNYIADEVLVNGDDADFFSPPPGERPDLARDSDYTFGEIGQLSSVWLWTGPYQGSLDALIATAPYPDLPGVWNLEIDNPLGNRQMALEIGDDVVVLDAPPHQSHVVLQWVEQTLGKSVTHVFVSGIAYLLVFSTFFSIHER